MQRLQSLLRSFLQCFFLATLAVAASPIASSSSQNISPQSLSSTGGQTTNSSAAGSPSNKIRCYPVAPERALKPLDCTNAILMFPREAKFAFFTRTSIDDRYRLPKLQVSGTCWIQVEVGILPERGSWNQIRDEMFDVYTQCVTAERWRGGGEVSFGMVGGLTVSIRNTIATKLNPVGNSSTGNSSSTTTNGSDNLLDLKPPVQAPLNGTGVTGDLKCDGPIAFMPGTEENCQTAIAQLPTYAPGDPVPAQFSTSSLVDKFKLPKTGLAPSCAASVTLNLLPVDEVHGWDTLGGIMQVLYSHCVVGQRRGGTATVGTFGGIVLKLQSMPMRAGGGGIGSKSSSGSLLAGNSSNDGGSV